MVLLFLLLPPLRSGQKALWRFGRLDESNQFAPTRPKERAIHLASFVLETRDWNSVVCALLLLFLFSLPPLARPPARRSFISCKCARHSCILLSAPAGRSQLVCRAPRPKRAPRAPVHGRARSAARSPVVALFALSFQAADWTWAALAGSLSVCLSVCPSVRLSVCPSGWLAGHAPATSAEKRAQAHRAAGEQKRGPNLGDLGRLAGRRTSTVCMSNAWK